MGPRAGTYPLTRLLGSPDEPNAGAMRKLKLDILHELERRVS
jgi:hypothetical protein